MGRGKAVVGVRRNRVGQQQLLGQPAGEHGQPDGQVLRTQPIRLGARELRHHFLVVQDRPGNQVREERDELDEAQRIALLDDAGIAVEQIADLREGEERHAQRQRHVFHRHGNPAGRHDVGRVHHDSNQRRQVLVAHQHRQIDHDGEGQPSAARTRSRRVAQDQPAHRKVERDRQREQQHERRVPPPVEQERRQAQPDRCRTRRACTQQVVAGNRNRQEQRQENERVE